MNNNLLIITLIITSLSIFSCKDKKIVPSDENKQEMSSEESKEVTMNQSGSMKSQSKIVVVDDLQFAFDLMPIARHTNFMEKMHIKMKKSEGATHGMMITLMSKKTKGLVKGAKIEVEVQGATGDSYSAHCTEMTGVGIHHYGVHLKLSQESSYTIKASVNVKGKEYVAEEKFTIGKI